MAILEDLFVTESWLRQNYKLEHGSALQLPKGARLTPSAHGLLTDRRIQFYFEDLVDPQQIDNTQEDNCAIEVENSSVENTDIGAVQNIEVLKEALKKEIQAEIYKELGYVKPVGLVKAETVAHDGWSEGCCALCQQTVSDKTDWSTYINRHTLVPKNDCQLKLQSRLESVLAQFGLLYAQIKRDAHHHEFILLYLSDLRANVSNILRAIRQSEPIPQMAIAELDEEMINRIANNPLKHIGVDHLYSDGSQGVNVAQLDVLRTQVRELEIEASEIYIDANLNILREDVLLALNKASRAIYVLMLFVYLGETGKLVI